MPLPTGARIALVSTRRAQAAADAIAGSVFAKYILHDMLTTVTAPMHELSSAHLVVLEIPPVVTAKFEHDLLNFVQKIIDLRLAVLAVVQPSLRRRSNKTLWVHKWNQLPQVPFKFGQTCSCKTGNHVPGCHLTYYVGCTARLNVQPCGDVPTFSTSPQASIACLGGTLNYLSALLLSRSETGSGLVPLPVTAETPTLCDPPASARGAYLRNEAGAQQTPDSAVRITGASGSQQTEAQAAYPTDAKAKEKAARQADKEAGITRVVKKRPKKVEDHYDDCGDDLSSLTGVEGEAQSNACFDMNDILSDEDREQCLLAQFRGQVQCYPIDATKVAKAQPGSTPAHGPDPRAADRKDTTCPGCKHARARDDWEHTREIGQCKYPYDDPWIPECIACQERRPG